MDVVGVSQLVSSSVVKIGRWLYENANKSPKIRYAATVRKVEKIYNLNSQVSDQHKKLISSSSWKAQASMRSRSITFAVTLLTDRMTDRITDKQHRSVAQHPQVNIERFKCEHAKWPFWVTLYVQCACMYTEVHCSIKSFNNIIFSIITTASVRRIIKSTHPSRHRQTRPTSTPTRHAHPQMKSTGS